DGMENSLSGGGSTFGDIGLLIGLLGGTAMLWAAVKSAAHVVEQAQSMVVTDHMQDILHQRSVAVDLEYYEDPRFHDSLHRAQQEAPYRPTAIVRDLVETVRNAISLLAMVGLLLSFHWGVSLVLAAAALPGVLVKLRFSRIRWKWQRKRTETERRAWYKHWLLTSVEHAKELRLFGLGRHFRERYRDLRDLLRREDLAISRRKAGADLATELLATVLVYGSLAFIAWRTFLGLITIGSMVMFFQAFRQGLGYLRGLLGNMADLYEGNLFLQNLFEFLDIPSKIADPPHPKPFPSPVTEGIVLDRVSFTYPGGGSRVIDDVSLSAGPGEMVALVGENGSGKTTLAKLICRLYDPDSGQVRIDGIPVRELSVEKLRGSISILFQDFAKYHLSAAENIALGDIRKPPEMGSVVRAAETAGAHEFLSEMPEGYDTILGRWFRGGRELSTGEWQKIALARAFFRNAPIVILDEPTSALDAGAEEELFRKFRSMAEGRTSLVISHRFSTVRMADRIAVLHMGRIAETGTHSELMDKGGLYSRMYRIQAAAYG
ncbi:MAG: ABC transporter ATP-binding protein, partial [Candidatus Fermentibacteraceae bacterium]|nr:ABC transporter ATP-binding protein [Candidatus Fermentibacteraceae bacterium]